MQWCQCCYSPAVCKDKKRCYRNMQMDPPSRKATSPSDQDWAVAFQDAPDEERKAAPIDAIFKFWPDAMLELAKHIWEGNKKYNPDHPKISWRRELSSDHVGSMFRHIGFDYIKAKTADTKIKVMRAVAWRALAQLQILCEERNG